MKNIAWHPAVSKKILLIFLLVVAGAFGQSQIVLGAPYSIPEPAINVRDIIDAKYLDHMQSHPNGCCVLGSDVYIYENNLNQSMNKIQPLHDQSSALEVTLENKSVKYFHSETATGPRFAYYISSDKGGTCIGYALFEEIMAEFHDDDGNSLLDIDSVIQNKGFSVSDAISGPPLISSPYIRFSFYERQNNGYIERVVVGTHTNNLGPIREVFAEMFYPQDMDADFRALLIQYLNQRIDLINNPVPDTSVP